MIQIIICFLVIFGFLMSVKNAEKDKKNYITREQLEDMLKKAKEFNSKEETND